MGLGHSWLYLSSTWPTLSERRGFRGRLKPLGRQSGGPKSTSTRIGRNGLEIGTEDWKSFLQSGVTPIRSMLRRMIFAFAAVTELQTVIGYWEYYQLVMSVYYWTVISRQNVGSFSFVVIAMKLLLSSLLLCLRICSRSFASTFQSEDQTCEQNTITKEPKLNIINQKGETFVGWYKRTKLLSIHVFRKIISGNLLKGFCESPVETKELFPVKHNFRRRGYRIIPLIAAILI